MLKTLNKTALILLCLTVIFAVAFGILWLKGNYTTIILTDMGILHTPEPSPTPYMPSAEELVQNTTDMYINGWTSSIEKNGYTADVVFFGDSLTMYGDFGKVFQGTVVANMGVAGDTLRGMLQRVEMISLLSPEKVFFMGGINSMLLTTEENLSVYAQILDELRSRLPDCEIYVQSVLPIIEELNPFGIQNSDVAALNDGIQALCAERGIEYIDLYSLYADSDGRLSQTLTEDGLHINADGYSLWYDAVKGYVY